MDVFGFIVVPDWILFAFFLGITYYLYMTWRYDVFKKFNIPCVKPWPIVGDMGNVFSKGMFARELELIQQFKRKGQKCYGFFMFRDPIIMVMDPKMIKKILVTNSEYFYNRDAVSGGAYPNRKRISVLMDDHWKHVRSVLNPSFSTGKLKLMMGKINKCATQLVTNLGRKAAADEVISVKEYMGIYTMEIIASVGYGIEIDCQSNKDDPFVKHAEQAFNFSQFNYRRLVREFFPFLVPVISYLGVDIFPKEATCFFQKIVDQAIDRRKETSMIQKDLLQLMLDSQAADPDKTSPHYREGKSGTWTTEGLTKEEIISQAIVFMIAGYETTASALTFMAYCLATNPHVQDKLIAEIDKVMGDMDEPTYEMLVEMDYLELCFNETLRLYPPVARIARYAKESITLEGVTIPKNVHMFIPMYALHHDADFFDDPEIFKPERHYKGNNDELFNFTWLPFGGGPKHCIGKRLALMEVKIAMIHMLRKYRFVKCSETEIPLPLVEIFVIRAKNGVKLKLASRG